MLTNRKAISVIATLVAATLLAACDSTDTPASDPSPPDSPQSEPDAPVSPDDSVSIENPDLSDDPATPIQPTLTPTLIPDDVVLDTAIVDSFDVLILESFPVQIQVVASGNLPDGCTAIDDITTTRSGDTFTVSIGTTRPAAAQCTMALVPFEESISLDVFGLPAGTYTVNVNNATGSFALDIDNAPQQPPSSVPNSTPSGSTGDQPTIKRFDVQVISSPLTVTVNYEGSIPDGCTGFFVVSEQLSGNTVTLTVGRNVPSSTLCTAAITNFQESYTLQSGLVAGNYTLVINTISGSFNIQ